MPSYTQGNNAKSFTNEKHAKRFPFWRERGTASLWLVVESRILYVRAWESRLMLLIAFLQKLSASFFIPQTCLFRTDLEPKAYHVKEFH